MPSRLTWKEKEAMIKRFQLTMVFRQDLKDFACACQSPQSGFIIMLILLILSNMLLKRGG